MPHLDSNNISLYYETHGTGRPLILISGLGGDRTFWTASVAALSRNFQVIIFDNRGIGKTSAPQQPYSMDLFADDLAGLMDGLGFRQADILGFSMGGNIALHFAGKYPERVDRLIIAASCARLNTQIRLYVDAVLEVYQDRITARQMFQLIAPWLFSNSFLSIPGNEMYLQYDDNDPEQQSFYAWKNQYLAQRSFDMTQQLSTIKAESLILTGELDVFAQLSDAQVLADGIKAAILKVIPGAGHLFNYEKPDLFHREVLDFLAGR